MIVTPHLVLLDDQKTYKKLSSKSMFIKDKSYKIWQANISEVFLGLEGKY